MNEHPMAGKVLLVAGTGRGIGAATARPGLRAGDGRRGRPLAQVAVATVFKV